MRFINLFGMRFGRLIVLSMAQRGTWLCRCDCGKEKIILANSLRTGRTKSCGCLRSEMLTERNYRHGFERTRLHSIWRGMRQRCHNQNRPCYQYYGGRGIKICPEWNSFVVFRNWAMNNGYKDDLTIDRIDSNGSYGPSNCRWATRKEQADNRRCNIKITYNGETRTLTEWSQQLQMSASKIRDRIKHGWSVQDAFFGKIGIKRGRRAS